MICPKCGFDQPDDVYCAFCGIHIERYKRKKRKKQHIGYVLIALLGIAGIFVAINSIHHVPTPEPTTRYTEKEREVQTKDVALPEAKGERRESGIEPLAQRRTDRDRPGASKEEVPFRAETWEEKGLSEDGASRKPPLTPQEAEPADTTQGEAYTAKEWFEKGRALDDESDFEVEFYKKALESDPEFAPAYYRLGAIHYRRADYELADQEFAKFIKYASEADRLNHDIYVYYSPSDMERLSASDVGEQTSEDEAKKEEPVQVKGEEKETPAELKEAGKEISVEIEEAEEEVPEETGEAQKEAAEEAEDLEIEVPEETEGAEKETPQIF